MILVIAQLLLVCFYAQPAPPPTQSINIYPLQSLSFGKFCLGNSGKNGGTITVGWDGSRSSTGDVVLLNGSPSSSPAIFEIEHCEEQDVLIEYKPTTILSGSNGGNVTLKIGPTEKGESGTIFHIDENSISIPQIRVGGTLIIGPNSTNPGGTYAVDFDITFNKQ